MPKAKKQFDGRGSEAGCASSPLFKKYFAEERAFLKDLLFNSVKINELNFYDEFFVKNQLFENGYVGYYETTSKFYKTLPEQTKSQLGRLWKNGQYYDEYNVSLGTHPYAFDRNAFDAWRILLANPSITALMPVLETYAALLADCRVAIKQNINATKTPSFWVVGDPDTRLSIEQMIQRTFDGAAAVVVKKSVTDTLSSMKNETPFIADKVHQEYREILNEVLSRLGILTANTSKRERVQSAEVNAGLGQSIDSIYTIIDFWNKQIESYGLPYTMEFNGVSETLYTGEESESEVDL